MNRKEELVGPVEAFESREQQLRNKTEKKLAEVADHHRKELERKHLANKEVC